MKCMKENCSSEDAPPVQYDDLFKTLEELKLTVERIEKNQQTWEQKFGEFGAILDGRLDEIISALPESDRQKRIRLLQEEMEKLQKE